MLKDQLTDKNFFVNDEIGGNREYIFQWMLRESQVFIN